MKNTTEATWWRAGLVFATTSLVGCIGDIGDRAPGSSHAPSGGGSTSPTGGPDPGAQACEEHDCSNVVDAVVVPMLAESGLELTEEDNAILCRRMAIDLTGLAPTLEEAEAHCAGHDPKEMAAYFMDKPSNAAAVDGTPPYVFVNRRFWSRLFTYDVGTVEHTFYADIRDLDQQVADLYAGAIHYDEFVTRVLAHPAFLKRFGAYYGEGYPEKVALRAALVFLGRDLLPVEAANLANLWRAWITVLFDDALTLPLYPDCPTGAIEGDIPCTHWHFGLDGSRCAGPKVPACQSDVLGVAEMIPEASAYTPREELSANDLEMLRVPGQLFVAQPELAQQAADMALAKYLGWWKAGIYKPTFDVPAVRAALAEKFVADGYDVRKLDFEIVTSVLYTQAARRTPSANVPLWAFGPTKHLPAVVWLDQMLPAIGTGYGVYDFRFGNAKWWPGHFEQYGPLNVYRIPLQQDIGDDGGLISVFTRRGVLEETCNANGVDPAASPEALIDRAFAGGLGRAATPGEKATLLQELGAEGADGCPDLASCDRSQLAIALCRSLYMTSTFTYY